MMLTACMVKFAFDTSHVCAIFIHLSFIV